MTEYSDRIAVRASPEETFRFVSDVENLPKYLNTVHAAHAEGGERVAVEGEANHHAYHADGWFKTDQTSRTMRWGSDGENAYSGTMRVTGEREAEVECTLSFQPKPAQAEAMAKAQGSTEGAIRDGLKASLQSIKQLVEGAGGKTSTKAAT